ncbi:MGMT family protein [Pseudalkalibacillus hwajinpoensis]|uniref:MGMT family protein n=1 Tax=Guptibacillus hwajinpoensis TaxID=208199 RepID=A0A4V5PZH3_9BACL|nr:MGMT family protein [Pseudalkalibacillus hwajinpoensis]TKD70018.1 MGMT family protein [Pseudalkalibacillus hwajinpoensis]
MERFTERVICIIQRIPSGKVMTYGQIAKCAGSPRGARQVVRILHSMSTNYQLPWHRVINSKGEIGIKSEEGFINQKMMLEGEGIRFTSTNRIDLGVYRFEPDNRDD